jgi:hypothetical protein
VIKLLLILAIGSALAGGLARSQSEPPLLIDSSPAPVSASLDANG